MAYDNLANNFGYGSNPNPSFFTPSNDAFDASKAWGPSSNWSASNYDWSNKNPDNPDFTSMLKSQTFGEKPTEREKYNIANEIVKALPKAFSAFSGPQGRYGYGNQQRGYGSGSSDESEIFSSNGTVRKAGDVTVVTGPTQQYVTTPEKRSIFGQIAGVAAPLVGAAIGGPWGAAAGQAIGITANLV
jgi:hypothetical protein